MDYIAQPKDYWIAPNAIHISLNALGDANRIQCSVATGSVIMCYIYGTTNDGLGYDNGHQYRTWPIVIAPTYFNTNTQKYVYAAIPKNQSVGTTAMVVFPTEQLDIYGKNESNEQVGSTDYYFIWLQGIISEVSETNSTLERQWTQNINYGLLNTDQARDAKIDDTSWYSYSNLTEIVTFLKEIVMNVGSSFRNLFLGPDGGKELTSVATDSTTPTDSTTAVVTPAYASNKYLSRQHPDSAAGRITFQQGIEAQAPSTTTGISNDGDIANSGELHQHGNVVIGDPEAQSGQATPITKSANFMSGMTGWFLDNFGNMEVESLTVRSFLEVTELLINRLQAQEGDTIFTDNDQITGIQRVVENEGTQNESVSYILDLKEKWEGYFTAQQEGNIIKGIINTLAAKQSGVIEYEQDSDPNNYKDEWLQADTSEMPSNPSQFEYYERSGSAPNYTYTRTTDTSVASGKTYWRKIQGTDASGNKYYTSWMRVVEDRNTQGSTLGNNQIRVVLYGDTDTPAQKNFPPCVNMTIGRWGCAYNPSEEGISAGEKLSRERRQTLFYISVSDGRIMKLRGVNHPILQEGNYGTTLGKLPDFVNNWNVDINPNRDYLYAQGIVVGDFIKVTPAGLPMVNYVDCGTWVDGSAIQNPTNGNGIYLCNEYNSLTGQWETHDVWYYGCKWRCLQHQPVSSGGNLTYNAPHWNSSFWRFIEGNGSYRLSFMSSNGYSFRRGAVNTDITAYLFFAGEYNMDITNQVDAQYFNWTRHEQRNVSEQGVITYTEQDLTWNAQHQGTKSIHLSNTDMPSQWSTLNKAIFTLTVTILDGDDTIIVQNQIIS